MKDFVKAELSLDKCKSILCKDGEKYTDKEVEDLRTFLSSLVEIDYHHFQKQMQKEKETMLEI